MVVLLETLRNLLKANRILLFYPLDIFIAYTFCRIKLSVFQWLIYSLFASYELQLIN